MVEQSGESQRPLRIAFIGARGVVGTYSGIETYYEEVGSRLAERGHEVTAYCRSYFTPKVPSYRGIRVRRLPSLRTKHLETVSHSLFATIDCLFRRFDVVQFHAIGSAPLALLPRAVGAKTVVSVRGLDWARAKWGRLARTVLLVGEWASARCPTATAVVSETLQRHYEARHGKTPVVIPNAVMVGESRPIERTRRFGLEKDGFLLYAGRISPEKGVHTLLEALRPLPRSKKLVIAGGSSYSDAYIDEVKSAAWEDVQFIGKVGREEMEELLSNCYAFILPSEMEGLSIALLEALSYGNCIIATDIPENIEVIGDAGLLFPYGDAEELRSRLALALENPGEVERLRGLARERAKQRPDWDEVARLTEEFYWHLVHGSGTRDLSRVSEKS